MTIGPDQESTQQRTALKLSRVAQLVAEDLQIRVELPNVVLYHIQGLVSNCDLLVDLLPRSLPPARHIRLLTVQCKRLTFLDPRKRIAFHRWDRQRTMSSGSYTMACSSSCGVGAAPRSRILRLAFVMYFFSASDSSLFATDKQNHGNVGVSMLASHHGGLLLPTHLRVSNAPNQLD